MARSQKLDALVDDRQARSGEMAVRLVVDTYVHENDPSGREVPDASYQARDVALKGEDAPVIESDVGLDPADLAGP